MTGQAGVVNLVYLVRRWTSFTLSQDTPGVGAMFYSLLWGVSLNITLKEIREEYAE